MLTSCSLCNASYHPGHPAFCPACIEDIERRAGEAEEYRQRVAAGDVNVRPENEADARQIRDAISTRLRESGSVADCQPIKKSR